MEFDPYEFIRSGECRVVWNGIPGHEDGIKKLSADEGPQELREILEWGKAGGQITFFYQDSENPNKEHETELFPPL